MKDLKNLTQSELTKNIEALSSKEREIISEVVLYLSELDRRGLYRDLGYSSLFAYCTEGLGYSEGAAMRRIKAARCLQGSPEIYQKLREGRLTLCAVSELSRVLTPENKAELFQGSEGQSKREVEKLVLGFLPPELPKRESIRVKAVTLPPPVVGRDSPPVERRYSISFEADEEFMGLLEEARACSGAFPTGEVLKRALKKYVSVRSPLRRAERRKARKDKATKSVSTATRDSVFVRDRGQCSFVGVNGRRCCERKHLQIEHCYPRALGGGDEEGNLWLLCPAHNRLMAERVFGREKVRALVK